MDQADVVKIDGGLLAIFSDTLVSFLFFSLRGGAFPLCKILPVCRGIDEASEPRRFFINSRVLQRDDVLQ